jgi:hypothetical protein
VLTAENLVLALENIIAMPFVGTASERGGGVRASHKFGNTTHSEFPINI